MPAVAAIQKSINKIKVISLQVLADIYEESTVAESTSEGGLVAHKVIHPAYEKPITLISSICGANLLIESD